MMFKPHSQMIRYLAGFISLLLALLLAAWFLTAQRTAAQTQRHEPVPVEWFGDRGADRYENNYDAAHAPLLALGEDLGGLNFACPRGVAPDCEDQDWYAIPLKGGLCYVAETRDLRPGLDTNLVVYQAVVSSTQPITTLVVLAGNDDAAPGQLASRASWCLAPEMPAGLGYLWIGNDGVPPEPRRDRTYTLSVRVVPPALLTPTPTSTLTPRPTSTPAPLPPTAPLSEPTVVPTQAPFQAPDEQPGEPFVPTATIAEAVQPTLDVPATSTPDVSVLQVTPSPRARVTLLDQPAATVPAATPVRRVPVAVTVHLLAVTTIKATPTPRDGTPIAGIRVQLVNVFGDVLAEGVTPATGQLTLRRDSLPGSALALRIPALGMQIPVRPDQATYLVTIPMGGEA